MEMPAPRVENILVSLPLTARFESFTTFAPDSPEGKAIAIFQKPKDWLGIGTGAPTATKPAVGVLPPGVTATPHHGPAAAAATATVATSTAPKSTA
jgi:hypothetical protein